MKILFDMIYFYGSTVKFCKIVPDVNHFSRLFFVEPFLYILVIRKSEKNLKFYFILFIGDGCMPIVSVAFTWIV